MRRIPPIVLAVLLVPVTGEAQANSSAQSKIANAMEAAPSSISAQATIKDWPATEGGEIVTLRDGTNGWTCLPDYPGTDGNDPMCVDEPWLGFLHAMMTGSEPPRASRLGIGYMIAPGGAYTSNTTPGATAPTPDNQWGFDPPHLMVLAPDHGMLEGLPTRREGGGPWVMFPGTPFAHVMVPIESMRP